MESYLRSEVSLPISKIYEIVVSNIAMLNKKIHNKIVILIIIVVRSTHGLNVEKC